MTPPPHSPADEPEDAELPVLGEPADGLPEVIVDRGGLDRAVASLAAGDGPVAIDAERAHGFRYSQRAYLVQLRRHGAGTILLDPVGLAPATAPDQQRRPTRRRGETRSRESRTDAADRSAADLSPLADAIDGAEWVLHAATQDLPCLAELSLLPQQLFDTELAGRLLGYPRVNLGTLIEENFHVRLLKEHSAADWSSRPLPTSWLNYAALDVELLIDLRRELADQLVAAGKQEWARQEFAWLVDQAGRPSEERPDPWRRTSGIHKVRTQRGMAIVASLWRTRDQIARRLDKAPGKILPDLAITELAGLDRPRPDSIRDLPGFQRRNGRRYRTNWVSALEYALELPENSLPPLHRRSSGPPQQARLWTGRNPAAADRLHRCRDALTEKSEELTVPVENLLTPDHLRRLAWDPPKVIDESTVDATLEELGARAWQREIVTGLITPLLITPES